MAKIYSKYEHSYVTIKHPDNAEGWEAPCGILLHTGTHVWVPGCYAMLGHPEVIQVGIGGPASTAFDEDGCCILAVPAAWCEFWTEEDAENIDRMQDADARLLSYARG